MNCPSQFSDALTRGYSVQFSCGLNKLNPEPADPCQNNTPVLTGAAGSTLANICTAFQEPPSLQFSSALTALVPASPITRGKPRLRTLATYALNVASQSSGVQPCASPPPHIP